MDKSETTIYIKQAFALFIIYIFIMILVVHFNPIAGKMICDENYLCHVEIKYVWNIKRNGEFFVNEKVKMRFYTNVSNDLSSGYLNLYKGGLNTDPFGTADFYPKNFNTWREKHTTLNNEIERFDNYIKKPETKYELEKHYNKNMLNIIGGIITLMFIGLSLTKRPINVLFNIITAILSKGRY